MLNIKFYIFLLISLPCMSFAENYNGTASFGNKSKTAVMRECSSKNSQVCAVLEFTSPVNSYTEATFQVTFQLPAGQPPGDLKIRLWMDMGGGHGHGSAPVEIISENSGSVRVQNAWFVMMGQWLVQVNFVVAGTKHQIDFPVNVME